MSVSATEALSGYFGSASTTNATSTTASSSTSPSGSTTGDKDMFLKLLVAQMKYQDPMNPTDSSQFLSQSAQFTALEKMEAVADQTKQLLGAQMAFGASGLVGQKVSYTATDGSVASGTVGGVTFGSTGPVLDIGGVSVPMASVVGVGTSSSTAAATTA